MADGMTLVGCSFPSTVAYDTDAQNYFNAETTAGGSFTAGQKTGINRWYLDMKGIANPSYFTANVYSRLKVAFLITQGFSAARDFINAISPGTFDGTDTGSPTYNSTNKDVSYNGTSQYTNTNFTPNNSGTFATADFTGYFYHRTDTNNDSNATMGEVGGGNSYSVLANSPGFKTIINCGKTVYNTTNANGQNNFWGTSWDDSSHVNAYLNGVSLARVNVAFDNSPLRSQLIGAFNAATPGFGGACTFDHYISITGAWTDAEAQLLYNAGKALKVALGGTAWN